MSRRVGVAVFNLAVLGVALSANMSFAQTAVPASSGGWSVQYGARSEFFRVGLNWETPVWWRRTWQHSGARCELNGEMGLARWETRFRGDRVGAWQIGLIPMIRYWPAAGTSWFFEGGIGPTVFSRTRYGYQNISTAFQFGDHIGVGWQIDAGRRLSLRLSHYSNADIRQPNPGFTLLQLTLAVSH